MYGYHRVSNQTQLDEINKLLKQGWIPVRETSMGDSVLILLKHETQTQIQSPQEEISLADTISRMCRKKAS